MYTKIKLSIYLFNHSKHSLLLAVFSVLTCSQSQDHSRVIGLQKKVIITFRLTDVGVSAYHAPSFITSVKPPDLGQR